MAENQTSGELLIRFSAVEQNQFEVHLVRHSEAFSSRFSREISASIREDMRLLRWKAVGLHDPGDCLLIDVGDRLSRLLLPANRRDGWIKVMEPAPKCVRIRFGDGTEELLHLPWELLHLEKQFVLQHAGTHIVREIVPGNRTTAKNEDLRVLHISLGTDASLRLDEERCTLLDSLPPGCPITFLLNPTLDELADALDAIRASMVVISGHGNYDDVSDIHTMDSLEGALPTQTLVHLMATHGCQLLLLWTCESARVGPGVVTPGADRTLPTDFISFTYPVLSSTALTAVEIFIKAISDGASCDEAVTRVRAIHSGDVYSFFNVVHYHVADRPFFQQRSRRTGQASVRSTRCAGREHELLAIDISARECPFVTVLAPVGSGSSSFLSHWHFLNSRSAIGRSQWIETGHATAKPLLAKDGIAWLVIDDPEGLVSSDRVQAPAIRCVSPRDYKPWPNERLEVLLGIDRSAAIRLAHQLTGSPDPHVLAHPLLTMPGFLERVAAGDSCEAATLAFEIDNSMPERYAKLGVNGKLFASYLFTMRGVMRVPHDVAKQAQDMGALGANPRMIAKGAKECLRSAVVFRRGENFVLAPEFFLLGEKWFPNWRTEHLAVFQQLCAAFATLDYHGKLDPEMGKTLLAWAIRIGAWKEAGLLCIRMSTWHFQQGQLNDMEDAIRQIVPHVSGEEKLILEGNLISILTSSGRYAEALTLHKTLEAMVRALPERNHEYFLNLVASLTQQVDCLIEMDRLQEALTVWDEALHLTDDWSAPEPDVRPRLLGQRAVIYKESGDLDSALTSITEAVRLAENCKGVLCAELRNTRCDILLQLERLDEAEHELLAVAPLADTGTLRSRYLHLKGLLMEKQQDPRWVEHILHSLEYDRQRGDLAGVAISLVTLARIFIDQGETQRAKERLREAVPYIQASGLASIVGRFARLLGEIDLAEGSKDSARSWLVSAKKFYDEAGEIQRSEEVNRLFSKL